MERMSLLSATISMLQEPDFISLCPRVRSIPAKRNKYRIIVNFMSYGSISDYFTNIIDLSVLVGFNR